MRVHRATPSVYERHASEWDAGRAGTPVAAAWLKRVTAGCAPGADVLDLGCGGGDPIARWLADAGFAVTGVDQSTPLLALCRERLPAHRWLQADMCAWVPDRAFGAIIGWDSFFHLDPVEQRGLLPRLASALAPRGRLLLTIGEDAGEVLGVVAGQPVYHSSLGANAYEETLRAAGCVRVSVTVDPRAGRTLLLAER